MRQGKRILSVMLALFLLAGLLSVPVFADGEQTAYKICYHQNYESASEDVTVDLPDEDYVTVQAAAALGYEREGYQFVKWTSDETEDVFFPGEYWEYDLIGLADENKIIHLYAQWNPYYVVAYQANNGQSVPAVLKGPYNKGEEFKIAEIGETGFKKDGYRFTGWKDKNGNAYEPGQTVSDLTDKPGEVLVVSLYAQWQEMEKSYQVQYDPNNESYVDLPEILGPYEIGEEGSTVGQFRIADIKDLNGGKGFEKEGYAFECWNTEEDGSGDDYAPGQVVQNLAGDGDTFNLYAQWRPLFYMVSYEKNIEDGSAESKVTGPYNIGEDEIQIAENEFANPGNKFVAWNTKKDGSGTTYEAGKSYPKLTTIPGKVVHLFAQWEKSENIYWVTYHPNNGDESIPDKKTGPFEITAAGSPADVFAIEDNCYTNQDKVFICWNTKADGTGKNYNEGEKVSNLTNQAGSTVDLYAQWSAGQDYLVAYYPNVGNLSLPAALTGPYDIGSQFKIITVQKAGFVRNGYYFTGWNTKPDGTGKAYAAGQTVSDLTENPRTIVPLYAQWKPKQANTMTVTPKTKTYKTAKLKKAAKSFTIKAKNSKGKVTYTLSKAAQKAKIKVTTKGKVTVPKKCKKGTYTITVKAAGTDVYNPKSITVKIRVK